jgi:GTPase Era involved in 16S rRNA processing
MSTNADTLALVVEGRLTELHQTITDIHGAAQAAPLWRPAVAVDAQCLRATAILDGLRERLKQKLVVTIVGGTGIGKSTVFNALAQADHLSTVGKDRPTTRELIVLAEQRADTEFLFKHMRHSRITLRASPTVGDLGDIILIDTPDTDSTENTAHLALLKEVVSHTDVLLCGFDSENPKRWDHLKCLQECVELYPNEHLFVFLAKCDRQNKDELVTKIVPDFTLNLSKAWHRPIKNVFCISARQHLKEPAWDNNAVPLHNFDQFDLLKNAIRACTSQAGQVISSRLIRAEYILTSLAEQTTQRLPDVAQLGDMSARLGKLDNDALQQAAQKLERNSPESALGVNLLLYRRLSANWWGPVGWLLAIWSRMMNFGFVSLSMLTNPIGAIAGLFAMVTRYRKSAHAVAEMRKSTFVSQALREYRMVYLKSWMPLAESLISMGFAPAVRDAQSGMRSTQALEDELDQKWQGILESEVEQTSLRLSKSWFQLLMNAPTVAMASMIGWQTVSAFLKKTFFPGDYFIHALVALGFTWLLSFVAVQFVTHLHGGRKLLRRAFKRLTDPAQLGSFTSGEAAVMRQLRQLMSLRDVCLTLHPDGTAHKQ